VELYERGSQRVLAIQAEKADGSGAVFVADVSAYDSPRIIGSREFTPAEYFNYKCDMMLSRTGSRLFIQTGKCLLALNVPALTTGWEVVKTADDSPVRPHQLIAFGKSEGILAAWGYATAEFDSIPGEKKRLGQVTSY
jgi:hypothetical protein